MKNLTNFLNNQAQPLQFFSLSNSNREKMIWADYGDVSARMPDPEMEISLSSLPEDLARWAEATLPDWDLFERAFHGTFDNKSLEVRGFIHNPEGKLRVVGEGLPHDGDFDAIMEEILNTAQMNHKTGNECPYCYGSGGGPDYALRCPHCKGSGYYVPSPGGFWGEDSWEEEFLEWKENSSYIRAA